MSEADLQRTTCARVGSQFIESPANLKAGIALQTLGFLPLNGLRHQPTEGTCGWFIWGGEVLESNDDFFKPVHVEHLKQRCPTIIPYLGLPPGWRFLLAPGQEEVWFDESIDHE